MNMKNLNALIMVIGLGLASGCNQTGSTETLVSNIDTCMTYVNGTFTEYDVISICGTPSSISNEDYTYTGSKGTYVVAISINAEFETLWAQKSLVGPSGTPNYSYAELQAYVDQIRITISNQGGNIYDSSTWDIGGNEGVASGYITQINAFKTAQGASVSSVSGITLNGVAMQ